MFHPISMPMQRGWVGRVEGDEVVHLAAQTLQHLFTGGGSARDHARYPLADVRLLSPLPTPPSVRVFDSDGAFEFANPAAVVGPGSSIKAPTGSAVARLRAPALAPPKDRDFGIVLGPWFTTMDEAPPAPTVHAAGAGGTAEA